MNLVRNPRLRSGTSVLALAGILVLSLVLIIVSFSVLIGLRDRWLGTTAAA